MQRTNSLAMWRCAAVHALGCCCAAAQRDASGRGVFLLFLLRRLATFVICACGRAVPAVRSRTALRLRILIYNAHCDAGLFAERGQVLLITCRFLYKRWNGAATQRRWNVYSYKRKRRRTRRLAALRGSHALLQVGYMKLRDGRGWRSHSQVDEGGYSRRLCTVSDGNERLRRGSMCTAASIMTRSLLV